MLVVEVQRGKVASAVEHERLEKDVTVVGAAVPVARVCRSCKQYGYKHVEVRPDTLVKQELCNKKAERRP